MAQIKQPKITGGLYYIKPHKTVNVYSANHVQNKPENNFWKYFSIKGGTPLSTLTDTKGRRMCMRTYLGTTQETQIEGKHLFFVETAL